VVEFSTGTIVRPIHISARGFSDAEAPFAAVVPMLETDLKSALARGDSDSHRLSQVIRRTVGKWVSDTYRRRPMIIPTVLEV